jgi:hypothetical protein
VPPPAAPPPVGSSSEPTAPPPPPSETDWSVPQGDPEKKEDNNDGLLGPIRIGPVVGVGIPNLLNFGGTLKITDYIGAGLNIGIIPAIKLSLYGEAVLSYQEYDIYGRIYPFGGGFYVGAGVGYETVKGTFSDTIDSSELAERYPELDLPATVEYESNGRVRTMILTPQIGYFYTSKIGFSIGLFVGAQIPIAPSDIDFETSIKDVPQATIDRYVAPLDEKVKDTLETVARQPLPSLGFQIGWLL